jgi:hypothetical protein
MTNLTGIFCWRRVCELGYMPLESFLSTIDAVDSALICVDPTDSPETMRLCDAIAKSKHGSKTRIIEFEWPKNAPGDGSKIGIATQYAMDNARGTHVLNVQADEVYPVELTKWISEFWVKFASAGIEGFRFKVLHTEFNAQQYQGGDESSTFAWQVGAGYNLSIKLAKKCPAIKISHDAWSFDGVASIFHVDVSDKHPIMHLHDFFRDHYIGMRQNAAREIWTDRVRAGNYAASANAVEASKSAWIDDPKWTATTSRFEEYINPIARDLIGKTHYEIDWSKLE